MRTGVYRNFLAILGNSLIKKGKKYEAEKICFAFLRRIRVETRQSPIVVLMTVLHKIKPIVTLKGKRVAGTNLKIPALILPGQDNTMAIKWFIESALSRGGNLEISEKLLQEVLDILANKGSTVKKRNDLHRLALVNRPFLKFI